MAIYCGSENPKGFQALVDKVGEREARYLWQINKGQFDENGVLIPFDKRSKTPIASSNFNISTNSVVPVQNNKGLVLNAEQRAAVEAAKDFLNNGNPDEIFVIQGKAGTGKSTIIREVFKEEKFKRSKIIAGALSNKATKVIRNSFKQGNVKAKFHSIAGMLGFVMDQETGVFKRAEGFEIEPPISSADYIVIDEASMVNEEALELIMQDKPANTKVIFLGDIGQLPPIRTASNPYYKGKQHLFGKKSPVFTAAQNKAELITRVRQGEDSPILEFADYFWENSLKSIPEKDPAKQRATKITNAGALIFANNSKDIMDSAMTMFEKSVQEKNPDLIRFVVYKNDTRTNINTYVHEKLFGSDAKDYEEGEIITFNGPHEKTSIDNATDAQVLSSGEIKTDEYGINYQEITIAVEDNNSGFVVEKSLPVVKREDLGKLREKQSELFDKAKSHPRGSSDYRKAMKEAWDYSKKYGNIDYAYAITSHKAQGSTYDVTIVHEKDIMSVGPTSDGQKSESIYTALTRPRNVAVVLTGSPVEYTNTNFLELNNTINSNKGLAPNITKSTTTNLPSSNTKINIYAGTNENAELSNFAIRPFVFQVQPNNNNNYAGKKTFQSVEQAFQWHKVQYADTIGMGGRNRNEIAEAILNTTDGAKLRKLGRDFYLTKFKDKWDRSSSYIMKELLKDSFEQNPNALAKLLSTGNAELTHTQDKGKWGKEFPKLLMEVRSELSKVVELPKNLIQQTNNEPLKGYISHSGGALKKQGEPNRRVSADLVWEDIGLEYGVETRSYSFPGHDNGSKKEFIVDTSKDEYSEILKEAKIEYSKAAKSLGKAEASKEYVRQMMYRNWFQVKFADKIFAVGKIINNKVDGGTGYAVQMAINNNKPVVVFDQTDNSWKEWNGSKFVVIDTPILTKNFAGIGTREITEKGIQAIRNVYELSSGNNINTSNNFVEKEKIDFSSSKNKFGQYKQDLFSQFLNATVDIASDPYFTAFNFVQENIGAAAYLLHYGWHPRTITLLMNQPIIRAYNEALSKLSDPKGKNNLKLSILLGKTPSETFKFQEGIDLLTSTYGYSPQELDGYDKTSSGRNFILSKISELQDTNNEVFKNDNLLKEIKDDAGIFSYTQRQIFAFYLKTQKQAELLRDLQTSVQMDTKKISTPIEALSSKLQRKNVLDNDLFDSEAVNKLWNNSMVSSFDYVEDVEKVFKALMPITMDEEVIKLGFSLYNSLYGTENKKKFHKVFFNDWVEFIIKNFGEVNNKNIEEYGKNLVINRKVEGQKLLTDVLKEMNIKYPKLFQKMLLPKMLLPNISQEYRTEDGVYQIKNLELGGGLETTTEFKNIITEDFRKLTSITTQEVRDILNDESITDKEATDIREFFKNLQIASFYQSGFNMSPISFFETVPYENILPIFKEALDEYSNLVENLSAMKENILKKFEDMFKTENRRFKLRRDNLYNPASWRGKNYASEYGPWLNYGLSQEEWSLLSKEEKNNIKEC